MQEKRYFFGLGVENTAIFAVFRVPATARFCYVVFSAGSAEAREIKENVLCGAEYLRKRWREESRPEWNCRAAQ